MAACRSGLRFRSLSWGVQRMRPWLLQHRMLRHLMAEPELLEIAKHRCFKGTLYRFEHISPVLGDCTMKLSAFVPSGQGKFPGVIWLSGLTCTDESLAQRSAALQFAEELKLILIMPDTSPRGEGVPDEDPKTYDVGVGASFYVNATTEKYRSHYKMLDYITSELPKLTASKLPLLPRLGIMGHSMGGHGALVAALRNPGEYRSVSAFSPIVHPSESPWGQKAFSLYLGDDVEAWAQYDTLELLRRYSGPPLRFLVDQGLTDPFLAEQLKPGLLKALCDERGHALMLRMQQDYDHSYYFISSFIEDHLKYHASFLTGVLRWCPDPDHPLAPSVYSVDPRQDEPVEGEAEAERENEEGGEASDAKADTEPTEPVHIVDSRAKDIECQAAVAMADESLPLLLRIKVAPPAAGELRLRLVAASVCGADLAVQDEPRILGLEAAAVVEDVGEGVEDFAVGDHVIPCYHVNCGKCECCRRRDTNFCESMHRTGRVMADGTTRFSYGSTEVFHFHGISAFSEYTVVHADSVAKVRKDAPLEKICLLGGGVAAAMGTVWSASVSGASAVVFGLNAEGLAALRALQKAGARQIIAVDRDPSRLELAKKWGATDLLIPEDGIKDEILRLTGVGADVAFDCGGADGAACSSVVADWGRCLAVGSAEGAKPRWRSAPFGGWRPKLQIPLLVDLYMAGDLPLDDYITSEEPFAEINQVLNSFEEPGHIRKVLRF
ncbi:unnamed protein product [Effrenium voratum]|nr:unnamed protein product [Effrenium voratum]